MPRPENPIIGDGPVADLARMLRGIRERAGAPGYRTLAKRANYCAATLADAAGGHSRPTWEVAEAFARTCGANDADITELHLLWLKAAQTARAEAIGLRRSGINTEDRRAGVAGSSERGSRRRRQPGQPRPPAEPASPAQFVHQLRLLRAWAGQPGPKEISQRSGRKLAPSTMYDALNPARTRLPSLSATSVIVRACAPDSLDEWIFAWRVIRVTEFERENRPENISSLPPG
jgi:hypothetical protein